MFCPNCSQANPADAQMCEQCQYDTSGLRQRVFIGRQFVFVKADEQNPVALGVDNAVQTVHADTILSRHQHAIGFGDVPDEGKPGWLLDRIRSRRKQEKPVLRPLPNQPRLPHPALKLLTLVTDRKIYQPHTEATLFIVAPDAAGQQATLEVQIAGQKVYEAKLTLNQDGLALHRYDDLKEGEYTAIVTLQDDSRADCAFSVAEFTLSPLIATLEKHAYMEKRLSFTLRMLLLSRPYDGRAEFGLQCKVCGDRVVATQKAKVTDGVAEGEFDVSGHGGPFHVQVTTPDGNTALVAFPGTGAVERERIKANSLGQAAELGLLPWEGAEPVRGFYIGHGELNMTPLTLETVVAEAGKVQVASDLAQAQIVTLDPRSGESRVIELTDLSRGESIEFETGAPYTLFTVGAFLAKKDKEPFEGWGIVVRPVAFEATVTAPESARPGQEIDVYVEIPPVAPEADPVPAFCWLLVYDARLEHESPLPKLAKRIYESVRDGCGNLAARSVANALDARWTPPDDVVTRTFMRLGSVRSPTRMSSMQFSDAVPVPVTAAPMMAQPADAAMPELKEVAAAVEAPVMVMAPSRMEFPELAYQELFAFAGQAARTVRLGDQIGTWRVRAYIFKGADYRELTADVQADKPLYAELDLPAIASAGDDISAAVNYFSRERAELVIATPFGEKRTTVEGGGTERFPIRGPGRVEVILQAATESDMSARHVAPPGVQTVTASQLRILDQGETVAGAQVVAYASVGHVLKDTITALTDYPFG